MLGNKKVYEGLQGIHDILISSHSQGYAHKPCEPEVTNQVANVYKFNINAFNAVWCALIMQMNMSFLSSLLEGVGP